MVDFLEAADVCGQDQGAPSLCPYVVGGTLKSGGTSGDQADVTSLLGEEASSGSANASRCPGDDRNLSLCHRYSFVLDGPRSRNDRPSGARRMSARHLRGNRLFRSVLSVEGPRTIAHVVPRGHQPGQRPHALIPSSGADAGMCRSMLSEIATVVKQM